jgi:hypothetical protein
VARIIVIDDFREYAEMTATPLRQAGHQVMAMASEEGPLDFEQLIQYGPQAIVVGLYRNADAFDRPIGDWTRDVLGYTPLTQMEKYPAINLMPIMLIGGGVLETDIPTTLSYDLFLVFPKDIKLYVPKMEELVTMVKTRRKISEYLCPSCGNRLTFSKDQSKDLFCLRCHTAVAVVEGEDAVVLYPSGRSERVPMEQLMPPSSGKLPGNEA